MKRFCSSLLPCFLLFLLSGFVFADVPGEFVPLNEVDQGRPQAELPDLTGIPDGVEGEALEPGAGIAGGKTETGQGVPAYGELPVISKELAEKIAGMSPVELVRVIIQLSYQPQDVIAREVNSRYEEQMAEIRRRVKEINNTYAMRRNLDTESDAVNYTDRSLELTAEDRAALRTVNEEHEVLSAVIRNEIAERLAAEVDPYQSEVQKAVERLGGKVEFGTICVNSLVARVPAGSLERLAEIDGLSRVFGDRRMKGDLNIADEVTRVSDNNGLWDNGRTGGIYDPAILDSGTDLGHPGLEDAAGRTNFWSWYLLAGHADSWWNDEVGIDDLTGHGTHVMGIVGSYGTGGYPNNLGMSYGVEKAVTLKAGWRGLDGYGYMYWSDAMWLIDRALYLTEQLISDGGGSFSDDVDGLNLSYSGEITSDEDDFSRFFDSIISSYSDLPVTLSAGNSGPANPYFNSPACSYNAITVANVEDVNTPERDDDFIRSSSTRGPTEDGRRKPDIAAPGTNINSCNTAWETELDYIDKSGTSMSAPMVQGIAMDLMDAGVHDELEIKALLINTAQKNEGLIDFESDADGWSEAYGWGYMNAWAAYYHRSDVITDSVTERPNSGYYHLYKGQMREEDPGGEGRDRVTMVWNRHATYNPHDYPTTYYSISDLNLRLYRESDEYLIDSDLAGSDNVHQVRIDSGAGLTDVVVKAYAWSTNFAHGGDTETFALATEEDFVEVELPGSFSAYLDTTLEVEPGEEFQVTVHFVNNSELASHNNEAELLLPAGWTLLSGDNPASLGSIAGSGGISADAIWTVRAQSTTQDDVVIHFDLTHNSYGEAWDASGWGFGVDVQYDTTPPSPNPMTWAIAPTGLSESEIGMTCSTASDAHQPLEYELSFYNSPTGGSGGSSSGWQPVTVFTDTGLDPNNRYGYRARARDNAQTPNVTGYSSAFYAYTHAATPGTPAATNPTTSTLNVTIVPGGNPSWTECAIYLSGDGGSTQYYLNAAGGSNGSTSFWQSISAWGTVTATGLNPETQYAFRVVARNEVEITTGWSPWGYGTTSGLGADTIAASISCVPSSGTVPFTTTMSVTLDNLYSEQIRRIAGRIDVDLADGAHYSSWRFGYTNVAAGDSYSTIWNQNIPALGSMIGDNLFLLFAEDVTPAPYNQPPYPPAGDTDSSSCTVTAFAP